MKIIVLSYKTIFSISFSGLSAIYVITHPVPLCSMAFEPAAQHVTERPHYGAAQALSSQHGRSRGLSASLMVAEEESPLTMAS
jgi:hypothetical protein